MDDEYWVSEHVQEYLQALRSALPLEVMEQHNRSWHEMMQASDGCTRRAGSRSTRRCGCAGGGGRC